MVFSTSGTNYKKSDIQGVVVGVEECKFLAKPDLDFPNFFYTYIKQNMTDRCTKCTTKRTLYLKAPRWPPSTVNVQG